MCNAAVNPYFGPSADCPDDAFDRVMECNVKSNHWLMNMVIPGMKAQDGAIIVISSIAGQMGQPTLGVMVSQRLQISLARNMAVEHGRTMFVPMPSHRVSLKLILLKRLG